MWYRDWVTWLASSIWSVTYKSLDLYILNLRKWEHMIIVSMYEFLFHEIFLIFLHFQSIKSNYAGKILHRLIFLNFLSTLLSHVLYNSAIFLKISVSSILKIIHSSPSAQITLEPITESNLNLLLWIYFNFFS